MLENEKTFHILNMSADKCGEQDDDMDEEECIQMAMEKRKYKILENVDWDKFFNGELSDDESNDS